MARGGIDIDNDGTHRASQGEANAFAGGAVEGQVVNARLALGAGAAGDGRGRGRINVSPTIRGAVLERTHHAEPYAAILFPSSGATPPGGGARDTYARV
jgi:hypothetical protein